MFYKSTRSDEKVTAAKAIAQGLASDGGLFVPESFPQIAVSELKGKDYAQQAEYILGQYLTDYSATEIKAAVNAAYDKAVFTEGAVVMSDVKKGTSVLELWHGPTFAFKDMALQLLPYLLTKAIEKTGEKKTVVILVATSGDTGKAALAGFAGVDETKIAVFYPSGGVSDIQRLQMVTQTGDNVCVMAVKGNFDDAQTGVKKLFADGGLNEQLSEKGYVFSSANSINWGRLVPQIVYYFYSYTQAVARGHVKEGEKINFVVPTGNFGNILAGFYAKCMGLPVNKFICASNSNNVLSDFIKTGRYDRKRDFHKTISPSMDILVSSNLERMLYHLADKDVQQIALWMKDLEDKGFYDIGERYKKKMQDSFYGAWMDDDATKATIKEVFEKERYLMDTHTAVAWAALEEYRRETLDGTYSVVLSTASPFKFASDVLAALEPGFEADDAFAALGRLSVLSGLKVPDAMRGLKTLPVIFDKTIDKSVMKEELKNILGV